MLSFRVDRDGDGDSCSDPRMKTWILSSFGALSNSLVKDSRFLRILVETRI